MTINYFMYLVGFVLMMVLNLFRHQYYNITKLRAVLYTLITYVYGVAGARIMGKIYNYYAATRGLTTNSKVAIFGAMVFTPLLLIITVLIESLILKQKQKSIADSKRKTVSFRNTIDLLTPGIFIILTCAKFGCFCGGCCYGVPWESGVYNKIAQMKVFPVQLCEVVTMCLTLLLCYYLKKTRFYRRGMAYPLTAAVYCIGRFGWEFLRYYPEELRHFLFGLTIWQFACVIVFAASVISVAVLYKLYPSEPLKPIKKPVIR